MCSIPPPYVNCKLLTLTLLAVLVAFISGNSAILT
nr:MAG TPA: hypothetical protein [Caudoviricetes sp.]